MYIHIYICIYVYIHIYIERERETLNNMGLNCEGPLICRFLKINTYNTSWSTVGWICRCRTENPDYGSWASVDFGIRRGSWNKPPLDTEGWLYVSVYRDTHTYIHMYTYISIQNWIHCCHCYFHKLLSVKSLRTGEINLMLPSSIPSQMLRPDYFLTYIFFLKFYFIYLFFIQHVLISYLFYTY